jgi:GNAT superfamily N-acetyltransferase
MTAPAAGRVSIAPVPFDSDVARRLVSELDADLDVRYAADDEVEGEPDHAMLNVLTADVSPPRGMFLVAHLDGEPVGCGAIRPAPTGAEATAEIKRMYVAPAARGQGISRQLLVALEDAAAGLGYRAVVLETGIRQHEAMALYESAGYTRIPNYGAYRESSLSRCYTKALASAPST